MFKLFLLFVAVSAANICEGHYYYNVETDLCDSISENCAENGNATFYGCVKCTENFYAFRGNCYEKVGGNDAVYVDEFGATKCPKNYLLVETKVGGYYRHDCVSLNIPANEMPDDSEKKYYHDHAATTLESCTQWGTTGCTECNIGFYLREGLCIKDNNCNITDATKATKNKCTTCNKEDEDGIQLYNRDGFCEQCDENCVECDATTGYCIKCFNRYFQMGGKKCYPCDPNCDMNSCAQKYENGKPTCTKCVEGYYLVKGQTCMEQPENCTAVADDKGCTACKEGTYLIPHDYLGVGKFHYNLTGSHIGQCVPKQESCVELYKNDEWKTSRIGGCKQCKQGFVIDAVKYKGEDNQDYTINVCSGATQMVILAMIAFLVFVLF